MTLSYAAALAQVDGHYASTMARLANDPEYVRMVAAAEVEMREAPSVFWARNRLSLHLEVNTPMFPPADPKAWVTP